MRCGLWRGRLPATFTPELRPLVEKLRADLEELTQAPLQLVSLEKME